MGAVDYAANVWANARYAEAARGSIFASGFAAGPRLSASFFALLFLELGFGVLLIVYGRKLLPAWQGEGALAEGRFPFLWELEALAAGLGPKLKQAWLDMCERKRML